MTKKKKPISKYQPWIDAQRHFHLSDEQVLMARELGLNPHKFGKLANARDEPWKSPLPEYIEELYLKHMKKTTTGSVRTFAQMVRDEKQKKTKPAKTPAEPGAGAVRATETDTPEHPSVNPDSPAGSGDVK
ncbi:MAG: hypothetical protein PHF57_03880 [Methanoregula sp.]|jgi:hypothetical protein|nr:hypothetical protein [Methanoregula sp.]MDD5024337.1 hypothetical protein [Methanoregula sp.]MDD5187327.1 hypothetical protein [Methanoregula sp.]